MRRVSKRHFVFDVGTGSLGVENVGEMFQICFRLYEFHCDVSQLR